MTQTGQDHVQGLKMANLKKNPVRKLSTHIFSRLQIVVENDYGGKMTVPLAQQLGYMTCYANNNNGPRWVDKSKVWKKLKVLIMMMIQSLTHHTIQLQGLTVNFGVLECLIF